MKHANLKKLAIDDRGIVESALTMIPIMILFLSILQIAASSLNRREVAVALNGDATHYTINEDLTGDVNPVGSQPKNTSDYPFSDQLTKILLPTGSSLIITKRASQFPTISPLLAGGDNFNSYGLNVE